MFRLGKHEILIGLGSNSENSLHMLRQARTMLRMHPKFKLLECSPIYESNALLPSGAPAEWNRPYLNAVVKVSYNGHELRNAEQADTILNILKQMEKDLGRTTSERWAPRCIDLDILEWGGPALTTHFVTIPHPEITQRPFSLLPAADCATLLNSPHFISARNHLTEWSNSWPADVPLHTRRANIAWPELVAIINLTPDSFSDGGLYQSQKEVEGTIIRSLEEGASVIDIGAESTRPGATAISSHEEQLRLFPVIEHVFELKKQWKFKVSLDSRHPETIEKVLSQFPLDWINDVEGFRDPNMIRLARESKADLVVMHSLDIPVLPNQTIDPHTDPLELIFESLQQRRDRLLAEGIAPQRLIIDPGLGFGKTARQNFSILNRLTQLNDLKSPLLLGHSRKRFLDPLDRMRPSERDLESAIITAKIANSGVDFLRVHSVPPHRRALRMGNLQ